jgi:hypothetical protein
MLTPITGLPFFLWVIGFEFDLGIAAKIAGAMFVD